MKLLLYCFFFFTISVAVSQTTVTVPSTGCPVNTVSTNPASYSNSSDPTGARSWNWMTEDYTIYYTQNGQGTTGFPVAVRSPFYELISNPNTLHFVDPVIKDFLPADGWELLSRNFGSSAQGINNPYFMLYNRYTGIIRVFANLRNSGNVSANIASVTLGFGGDRRTALFNQLGEATNAVSNFEKYARTAATNEYVNSGVNDNYFWLWADFVSLYDPCTCGVESELILEIRLITETEVNLSVNGTETTILNNVAGNQEYEQKNFFSTIKQYADFGSGLVTDVGGIFSNANTAFDQGTALQADANEFVMNNGPLFGRQTASSIAVEVGRLLFEVPRVNSWLKFASTLITTVKKVNGDLSALSTDEKLDKLANITTTTKNTSLKVSGQLLQSSTFVFQSIPLAASNQQGVADYRKSIYNNILGVFNLLHQPALKITKFNPPSPLYYQYDGGYLEDNNVYEVFTPIYQVEVMDELTPVLNPASGLKIKSLESKVEFLNRESSYNKFKGPMIPGLLKSFDDHGFIDATITDRELYYNDSGYNLEMYDKNATPDNPWDRALMSTPYLPQGCFKSTSLFSFSQMQEFVVKVKVVLEPITENPGTQVDDIIIIFSYPAKVTNVTSSSSYQINGAIETIVYHEDFSGTPLSISLPGVTYSPFMGLPTNALFNDMTISHDYLVIGDLTIGSGVTYAPGNFVIRATGNIFFEHTPLYSTVTLPVNYNDYHINYKAGNEIIISPEVIITPETILEIDPSVAYFGCNYPEVVLQTPAAIKTYCESNDYNVRSAAVKSTTAEESLLDVARDNTNFQVDGFDLFPNPAKQLSSVRIHSDAFVAAIIRVTDLTGKDVAVAISESGANTYTLDLANCRKGIYFVTVSTYGGSQTKQLIVQ